MVGWCSMGTFNDPWQTMGLGLVAQKFLLSMDGVHHLRCLGSRASKGQIPRLGRSTKALPTDGPTEKLLKNAQLFVASILIFSSPSLVLKSCEIMWNPPFLWLQDASIPMKSSKNHRLQILRRNLFPARAATTLGRAARLGGNGFTGGFMGI